MTRNPHPGSSPAKSEQTLYELWDHIDRTREKNGEQAAQQLAAKALKVIAPAEDDKRKDKRTCH